MMESREGHRPSGWYEDESDPRLMRYWDGRVWGDAENFRRGAPRRSPQPPVPARASGSTTVMVGFAMMFVAFAAAIFVFGLFQQDSSSSAAETGIALVTAIVLGPVAMVVIAVQLFRFRRIASAEDRILVVSGFILGIVGAILMVEPVIRGAAGSL